MDENDEDDKDEQPDQYRVLFEHSADAILIIDGETFVDCNQATVKMLRYRQKADLLATHPSDLSPERQPDGRRSYDKANEMIAIALESGSHRFEWSHIRADGEVFPVEVLLTAVPGPRSADAGQRDARVLHVVWRDITERKRLEAALRHAQKIEAIGKLAGGIAHDFNNSLVAILGHAELLADELDDLPELRSHVEQIQAAGQHSAALTRQLLAFGREQELQPEVLDLNTIVADLDRMLGRLIGEDKRMHVVLSAEPVIVRVDPDQIRQVVINLATNARDAMPEGGSLKIETRAVDLEADALPQGLSVGCYASLAVTDSGVGMDARTVSRAFDPFFTTKPLGEGTGLGLSTVHGIVSQSGGGVTIASTLGQGTTVEVLLPTSSELPHTRRSSRRQTGPQARGGQATILLAEDDQRVARLMERVLRKNGYTVLCAADGEQALALLEEQDPQLDLLLTDVVMPNLSGPELARRVRATRPGVRVLFASGYTNRALVPGGVLECGAALLDKPFTSAELLSAVRRVLDLPPAS